MPQNLFFWDVLSAILIGIGFFISLNVRVITSARGNSLPGVQMCEATEVIVLPSKVTDQITRETLVTNSSEVEFTLEYESFVCPKGYVTCNLTEGQFVLNHFPTSVAAPFFFFGFEQSVLLLGWHD